MTSLVTSLFGRAFHRSGSHRSATERDRGLGPAKAQSGDRTDGPAAGRQASLGPLPERPVGAVELAAIDRWDGAATPIDRARALDAIERGAVVAFPKLRFDIGESERRFLTGPPSIGKSRTISFDFATGRIHGSRLGGDDLCDLAAILTRFDRAACQLIGELFPRYRRYMIVGRASFRSIDIETGATLRRRLDHRSADRRLHVDAFATRPSGGLRILRIFSNVNPESRPWVWRIGEPFPSFAARLLPGVRRMMPGEAWLLEALHVTRGRRTEYDHLMLALHDRPQKDGHPQTRAQSATLSFKANTTWVAFTDQVPHADLTGQHVLEQTFLVNPAGLRAPERAPLAVLEGLTGRALV